MSPEERTVEFEEVEHEATAELATTNGAGSTLDAIKARRRQLASRTSLDLVVPGYEGELGVRYRPVADEEFDKLVAKIQSGAEGNVDAACDLLIRACECILVRQGDDLEPLTDQAGVPIGYDLRLAEVLQYDATTARGVVRGLFSPDGTAPLAPGLHALAVLNWLQGDEASIDRSLLGN